MEPTQELVDDLYRAKVRQARAMSPEEKLLAGPELFEYACGIMLSGIRHQHPEADEGRIQELFRKRLDLMRRLESGD